MRAFSVAALMALVTTVGLGAGCTDLGVGAVCLNPREDGKVEGTQLSSPALECRSRLCVLQEKNAKGDTLDPPRSTCTARCTSDADCQGALVATEKDPDQRQCPNKKRFICAVATQTGPFGCHPICICEDDVQDSVTGDTLSLVNSVTNKIVCPGSCVTNPELSVRCEELRKNLPKK